MTNYDPKGSKIHIEYDETLTSILYLMDEKNLEAHTSQGGCNVSHVFKVLDSSKILRC